MSIKLERHQEVKGEPMGMAEDLSAPAGRRLPVPGQQTGATADRCDAQAGMVRLAREAIAAYEARVSSVERIIEATHEILEAFRSQREAMRTKLRETLARAASLRRRDFDAMMQGILAGQEERQERVKEAMRGYLREHKATAQALKEVLANGEAKRLGSVEELLGGITATQEKREREVKAILAEFRTEQEQVARALGGFLSNGGSLKVKDFKATLRTIQATAHSALRL